MVHSDIERSNLVLTSSTANESEGGVMEYPLDKLGKHIDILSGFAFKSTDFVSAGIPVIKIKNITPPSVSLDDLSYVTREIAQQQAKFQLKRGDVLIALTGSHINQMASVVGRVARVRYDDITLLNQRVGKVIITNPKDMNLDYVYYFLSPVSKFLRQRGVPKSREMSE